jgi:type I restriction enzyme, R subunit
MNKITETDIELLAIDELEQLGWLYQYGPQIACDGEFPERDNYQDVILKERLKAAIARINPKVSQQGQEEAFYKVLRVATTDLLQTNETFHDFLTNGITVEVSTTEGTRGDKVFLLDYSDQTKNEFVVVNQFTVIENHQNKRPDLILFINGIPLIIVELKNPADEKATVQKAFTQLQNYKNAIPSLFHYNAFLIASDGLESKAGTLSAAFSRFMAWKTKDGKQEASHIESQMITLIQGMLKKETVVDLIRHFIVFEKSKHEDPKTKITTIETIKKIAAYHQYYAVNKAVDSAIRASGINIVPQVNESPEKYGLKSVSEQPVGDCKGGVVWHTQGSGKSLSMVFFAGKMVLKLNNPTLVVITDRNDLDQQLFDTFASCRSLLRQEPVQANDRNDLINKLKVAGGGIIFTTVQKFFPDDDEVNFPKLSDRSNIIVIADEAHRTQYGFEAKTKYIKDDSGNEVGTKVGYGFAKHMRDALPKATFIGFTGTPVELTDRNTRSVFGNYIDIYDIQQAVEDGATVRIYYESRLAKVNLDEEARKLLDDEFEEITEDKELTDKQKSKAKWTRVEAIVGNENRLKTVATDIVKHFEERKEVFDGKAMVVCMSRRICVALYNQLIALRPQWNNSDDDKGALKVIMTGSSSDPESYQPHVRNKERRKAIGERLKDPKDPLQMVIVRDMWLTGFDAPCLNTLYIDKPMKGHNLMQAIARVNRVYMDKPGGLVVDYIGIAQDLKKALSLYTESGGQGEPTLDIDKAIQLMHEKLEVIQQLMHGYDYTPYFSAITAERLSIILTSEEHILTLENGKDRFVKEVISLSKSFALCKSTTEAEEAAAEIAFFQAIKARLAKFEPTSTGRSNEEIETAIRQLVDQAVVSEGVIDIFDAAGIKKPDISILSDEFLEEIKGMKHKNLALELLKKLLNDEIKIRSKFNLVVTRKLSEMLEDAIRRYQNGLITSAQILEAYIEIARYCRDLDKQGEKLNLSVEEVAFYNALEVNDSAVSILGDDILRDIARVLVERVKANTSIDWQIKENVRAKLRVIVRRVLREFGYPPDKQEQAVNTVLQQAELLADVWAKDNE